MGDYFNEDQQDEFMYDTPDMEDSDPYQFTTNNEITPDLYADPAAVGQPGLDPEMSMMPQRTIGLEQAIATALASAVPLLMGATSNQTGAMGFAGEGAAKSATTAIDLFNKENDRMAKGDIYRAQIEGGRRTKTEIEKLRQQESNKRAVMTETGRMARASQMSQDRQLMLKDRASGRADAKADRESANDVDALAITEATYPLYETMERAAGRTPQPKEEWVAQHYKKGMSTRGASVVSQSLGAAAIRESVINKEDSAKGSTDILDSHGIYNRNNLKLGDAPAPKDIRAFKPKELTDIEDAVKLTPSVLRVSGKLQKLMDEQATGVPQTMSIPTTIRTKDGRVLDKKQVADIIQQRGSLLSDLIVATKNAEGMGANFTNLEAQLVRDLIGANAPSGVTKLEDVKNLYDAGKIRGIDFGKALGRFRERTANLYLDKLEGSAGGIDLDTFSKRQPLFYKDLYGASPMVQQRLKRYYAESNASPYILGRRKRSAQ